MQQASEGPSLTKLGSRRETDQLPICRGKLSTCSNTRERVGYDHVYDACGVCCIVAHPPNGNCAGPAARYAGRIRFLRTVAIMVTIILRNGGRAWQGPSGKCAVRGSALFVRRARPMAAV